VKAKPAAKSKAKAPAKGKAATRAAAPVKAKPKAAAKGGAKAPAKAKSEASSAKTATPARKRAASGKPANPRAKANRPARPDGRTGTFKFRASPKPKDAAPAPVAAPMPEIPAELLDSAPKAPKPRKPRGKKEQQVERPVTALDSILAQLEDSKAEQVVTITLDDKSAIADTMVVATGRSNRHVGAIADQLVEKLKAAGHRDLKIEGMPQCDWVLVDAGDVVVHIFRPEVRSFYNLEKLWSDHAPNERLVT
jgi:ribosome-associated protein